MDDLESLEIVNLVSGDTFVLHHSRAVLMAISSAVNMEDSGVILLVYLLLGLGHGRRMGYGCRGFSSHRYICEVNVTVCRFVTYKLALL